MNRERVVTYSLPARSTIRSCPYVLNNAPLFLQVEEVIPVDIPSRKAIKSRKGFCCLSGGGQAMESPEKESPERPTAGLSSLVRDEFTRSLVPAGNSSPRRSPPRHHPVLGPLPPLPLDNLIGEQEGPLQGKKCLVLDLDETLVHSSFKPLPNPDFIIPVEIEGHLLDVYVIKRPHVDEFMKVRSPLWVQSSTSYTIRSSK